jgi:autotransporter-associated beta strand protein
MSLNHQSGQVRRFVFARAGTRSPVHQAAWQTSTRILAIASAFGGTLLLPHSLRADIFGNSGGPDLSVPASWTDETTPVTSVTGVPGSTDIARWDSLSAGGTFNLTTGTTWLGISVTNPTAAVTIGTTGDIGNTLTIGASGIDMTAAIPNLTLVSNTTLGSAQTWNIASGRTLTDSGTLNTNGVALVVAGAGNASFGGVVSGSGSITMSGTGTLSLTKANTYSGGTTVNSGTVALTTNTSAGTGSGDTITLNGGTLNVAGAASSALSNPISVTSASTISGSGTEEFSGSVTGSASLNLSFGSGATFDITNINFLTSFTGTMEMGSSVGTIRYAPSSSGGSLTHTNLDLGTSTGTFNNRLGGSFGIGSLAGGSGTVLTGSTTAGDKTTYTIEGTTGPTIFAGSITNGSGSSTSTTALAIAGGTQVLTGTTNTFSGGTTISGGTLQIGNGGSTTGSAGTAAITNNSILALDPGGSITLATAISGSGVVNHIGTGTTTLSGNNNYSGGTSITAGILVANNTTSALGTGPVTVTGGTLAGVGTVTALVTVGPGGGQITAGTSGVGTLSVSSLTLNSGSVVNTDFTAAGPTNLINITTANGLTVNGGGINLYAVGNNPLDTNGTYNIFQFPSAYTGTVPTNLLTVLNPPPSTTPTYTWGTSGNDITVTVSGLASAAGWNNSGGGSWTVAGNWTAGIPNAAGSTATFASSPGITAPATINLNGNETVGNLIFNNSTGNGSTPPTSYTIAQGSGGSLIIDNSGIQAGITDLNGSHLISAPVIFNSNVLVSVANLTDAVTLSGAISGNGGLIVAGPGTLVLSGSNTYLGGTNISSGTLQVGVGGTAGSIPAGAVTDNGTLAFNYSNTATLSNTISGTGSLLQEGPGTLVVASANTYTGSTNVSAGTLQIGTGGTISTGPLIVAGGALLDLNGTSPSFASLSGGGTIDNVTAGGTLTLTVGSGNSNTTFSGAIKNTTGTISLVKVGSGNLTLGGANTYTGTTTIGTAGTAVASAGTLTVTGSISGGGAFTVGDNDTLAVNGGSITASSFSFGSDENTAVSVTGGGSINVSTGALTAGEAVGNATGYLSITSGTVTAGSVTINRTGVNDGATIITSGASTTSGIYLNGGTLNVLTTLGIGTNPSSNSSANMRMDAGAVTVGGTTQVTVYQTSGRFSLLDLSGGTFTSNDTTGAGILIGGGTLATPDAELLVRGTAIVTTPTITLGTSTQTGGTQVLEDIGGTIYVGAGGIVNGRTSGSGTVNLGSSSVATAPILAASASWSSSLNMTLTSNTNFVDPTVQTANSSGGAENITLSGVLSGTGGLAKTGAGTLTLAASNLYDGTTNIAGGTLAVATTGIIPSATVSVASGATLNAGGSSNDGLESAVVLNINGTTNFAASNSTSGTPTTLAISSFNLGSGGLVTVTDPGVGNHANRLLLSTGGLTLAGTTGAWLSKVDLTGNDLQVENGTLANVYDQVKQGYNGGHWNGTTGITSSTAAGDPTHLTALAVIQNSQDQTPGGPTLYGSFDNNGASNSDVLVKYTYYGDANEDGSVTTADYTLIDAGYLSHGTLTGWYNGDFNYDGVINGSDYTLIDNAFNMQGASLASEIASPTAQIAGGSSSVPEPTSAMALVLFAGGLLGRRRLRR